MNEDSVSLPIGWSRILLGEYIDIAARIGWRGLKKDEYTREGPLMLSVKDIRQDGSVDYGNVSDHLSGFRYEESPEIQLRDMDILVAKDGTIGKVGFVEDLKADATVNSSILVVRPCRAILPRFLFHYLRGPRFQGVVRAKSSGTAVPHLFQRDVRKLEVEVPPLNEQLRIVSKLDEFVSRSQGARRALNRVLELTSALRSLSLWAEIERL